MVQAAWKQLRRAPLPGTTQALSIYTDGSKLWNRVTEEEELAWAFCVIAHTSHGDCILGFRHGWIHPDWSEPFWSNMLTSSSAPPDAFVAETVAILHALVWTLASPDFPASVPCTIHADALSALRSASGAWSLRRRRVANQVLRPLWTATALLGRLSSSWQKAHCGHVYNDLADHAAKTAARFCLQTTDHLRVLANHSAALPWLWLLWQDQLEDQGPWFRADSMCIPIPPTMTGQDQAVWPSTEPVQAQAIQFDLCVTTYNVGTLYAWGQTRSGNRTWRSRKDLLIQQSSDHHVVALQETRGRRTMTWSHSDIHGISSAASQGQGGCDLWSAEQTVCLGSARGPTVETAPFHC